MRTLIIALFMSLVLGAAIAAPAPAVQQYDSEEKAHIHCPMDKIVWVNPRTRLWYTRDSKHYANDRYGGFACKEEATKAGMKQGKE